MVPTAADGQGIYCCGGSLTFISRCGLGDDSVVDDSHHYLDSFVFPSFESLAGKAAPAAVCFTRSDFGNGGSVAKF